MSIYDPFRAKVKIAFFTAAASLMGLGIASALGWSGVSHAMPVIGTEPRIPIQAVQPALDLSDAFVNVAETVTPPWCGSRRDGKLGAPLRSGHLCCGQTRTPGSTGPGFRRKRVHHLRGRLHPYEQPRGGRRGVAHGFSPGSALVHGPDRGTGSVHGRRGDQDRRSGSDQAQLRKLRRAPCRRVGSSPSGTRASVVVAIPWITR